MADYEKQQLVQVSIRVRASESDDNTLKFVDCLHW